MRMLIHIWLKLKAYTPFSIIFISSNLIEQSNTKYFLNIYFKVKIGIKKIFLDISWHNLYIYGFIEKKNKVENFKLIFINVCRLNLFTIFTYFNVIQETIILGQCV